MNKETAQGADRASGSYPMWSIPMKSEPLGERIEPLNALGRGAAT